MAKKREEKKPSLGRVVSPIIKNLRDAELELSGTAPRIQAFTWEGFFSWCFAIPVGDCEYDLVMCRFFDSVRADASTNWIIERFDGLPVPKVVGRAGRRAGAIRNRYLIIITGKVIGKYFKLRTRNYPGGRRDYVYLFVEKLGVDGIRGRIYKLLGGLFTVRGERMGKNLPFELYGLPARVKQWFLRLGERLKRLADSLLGKDFVSKQVKKRSRRILKATRRDAETHKRLVLEHAKGVSEDFYRAVAALAAVIPADPG